MLKFIYKLTISAFPRRSTIVSLSQFSYRDCSHQQEILMRIACLIAAMAVVFSVSAQAVESQPLPASINSTMKTPLEQVGSGQYSKFGFGIYQASLWAAEGNYDKRKAYALQLRYLRGLSKDTVVSAVMDDIRAQKMADVQTMNAWQQTLAGLLPAVHDGDELVGLFIPGKPSKLYLNGRQIGSINDMRLSEAFANIWLGDVANPDLRAELLAQVQ